ncbi:hypothetical protein IPM62_01375 [Candidatus Woesebacteria bacterium]|nr:MAG: hypothetical protein IPM62_01375 [Candidatus Woesebacteria bacterium]
MDQDTYKKLFDDLVSLVDQQLAKYEKTDVSPETIARYLPTLISLVNTIGYLRGQDGVFLDFRPKTDNQDHFFEVEDAFEKRLTSLIEKVMASDMSEYYKKKLHSYFCLVRTNQPSEV